ncbi:hypothetical protein ABL78_4321 [Leptomonas seymouri]|uniref:Uncharacterized protein n=1 Tax=Leptomonas seymouri TaxID=5684 RepID=A0A0N1I3N4_LEPSE|nr:hypothetical protein ABL78_4321 [Leptomonas seymouri]|eukprot:KPI86592.1 hypothetical protein ABL78_4321 [Leptomonas seymouri]
MLCQTSVRRIGTLSTVLANGALYLAHWAALQTPASALALSGCFFRCLTLPLTVYGDQCLRRAACALPELQNAHTDYLSIVDHPNAIAWEKRVAAQKLQRDRQRIFHSYRTNNVKMFAPHAVAAAASLYCLGVPTQQIGTFFIQDAGMAIVSPLAVSYVTSASASAGHFAWATTLATTTSAAAASSSSVAATSVLFTVDPTLALAAGLTCFNVCRHLHQRMGFNTRLDRWIGNVRRAALGSCAVIATGSLLSGPLAYALAVPAFHFFPPYLAPAWLGMGAATALKNAIASTAPGRALFRLPSYPPQHGTYGEESTAAGHEYRLAFTGVDVEETRHVWETQKRVLDYECDVRIHRWLTRLGLFDELDELTYEADRLRQKRAVARQRRLARDAAASPSAEPEGRAAHAGPTTQAARRRHAMRQEEPFSTQRATTTNGADGVSEEALIAQMDRLQEEESKRRQDLKAAREVAWKQKH